MKLVLLHTASIILEGYGSSPSFDYTNYNIDPRPKILKLGTWIHPNTGNVLVGGVNLHYLSGEQIKRLQYYLPELLKFRNLRRRYWVGRRILSDIFKHFYRTYNQRYIDAVEPGTLRFMSPKELEQLGKKETAKKLSQRRDQLATLKKDKKPLQRPVSYKEPFPGELPPEKRLKLQVRGAEPIGPEVEVPDPAKLAKAAVDAKRASKLIAKIDDRVRRDLENDEAPEEPREEPSPEDIEEPDEGLEQPEKPKP